MGKQRLNANHNIATYGMVLGTEDGSLQDTVRIHASGKCHYADGAIGVGFDMTMVYTDADMDLNDGYLDMDMRLKIVDHVSDLLMQYKLALYQALDDVDMTE